MDSHLVRHPSATFLLRLRTRASLYLNSSTIVVSAKGCFTREFPDADLVFDQEGLSSLLPRIQQIVDQPQNGADIELDLRGTPYEIQVWNFASRHRSRRTTTYGALAAKLGTRDARDVTVAISSNPVAIIGAVSSHFIKKDGSISGYRWGAAPKTRVARP